MFAPLNYTITCILITFLDVIPILVRFGYCYRRILARKVGIFSSYILLILGVRYLVVDFFPLNFHATKKIVIKNGKLLIIANKLGANTVRYPGWTQVRICEVPLLKSLFVPVIQEGFHCRVKAVVVFKDYDAASLLHESGSIVE